MNASGPHQGQVFADWCSAHGIADGADCPRSASQTWNSGAQSCCEEKDVGGLSNGDAGLQP